MVLGHRRHSLQTGSNRSSFDNSRDDDVTKEDETVVDSEQGSMLSHIISQLRPGADLSRVTLPTFILEPRSMLERITNFMAHPETLLPMTEIEDPIQRFVAVVKFYLSGWHIKPPGVKKPLNPILGEIFTCYWDYPDNTKGYYISEQTSHHPPKSSYFFMAPEHHIRIDGTLKPRSKFLGNSAASMMEGIAVMRFLKTGERFFVTQPNMYARGILFGKMKYELGDHSYVRCPELGLMADLDFKTKGYFGGTYDAIGGCIKDTKTDKILFELSGYWNKEMYIKDMTTGKKELLFDATHAKHTPPTARPMEEQSERESQKLWYGVTEAIKRKDQDAATDEKTRIEEMQRAETAKRHSEGIDWQPQLFRSTHGGQGGLGEGEEDLDWIMNAKVDGQTPEEQVKQILQIAAILPGQTPDRQFNIPIRGNNTAQASAPAPEQAPVPAPAQASAPASALAPEQAPPQVSAQALEQAPTQVSAQPPIQPTPQVHSSNPTPYQPPHRSIHNIADLGDPVPEPAAGQHSAPQQQPVSISAPQETSRPEPFTPRQDDLMKGVPPSKLLHTTRGGPEPRPKALTRQDSETQEVDEFHDALT